MCLISPDLVLIQILRCEELESKRTCISHLKKIDLFRGEVPQGVARFTLFSYQILGCVKFVGSRMLTSHFMSIFVIQKFYPFMGEVVERVSGYCPFSYMTYQ